MKAIAVAGTTIDTVTDDSGTQVFQKNRFQSILSSEESFEPFTIKSKSGSVEFKFDSRKVRLIEFMKVLSLAHECVRD
jgi:hypothetical protein